MANSISLDFKSLLVHLKKSKLHACYLLHGEDSYLMRESLREIKTASGVLSCEDFNYDVFYAKEDSVNQVEQALLQHPVMAERRLVEIRQGQHLADKDWEVLLQAFTKNQGANPNVLVIECDKIDKRKKNIKQFLNYAAAVELKKPYDSEIPQWILRLASKHQLTLQQDAVELLQKRIGSDLSDLDRELAKLKTHFLSFGGPLNAGLLQPVVPKLRQQNVFELAEAIGCRDFYRASENLNSLLNLGESPVMLVSMLARHFRILLKLNLGLNKGLMGTVLAQSVGVPPFFLKDYLKQSKLWKQWELLQGLELLAETDRAIKSSAFRDKIWLERLIFKLAG